VRVRLSYTNGTHPEKLSIITRSQILTLIYRWGEGDNTYGIIATGNIDIEYDQVDAIGDMIITLNDAPSGLRFERFKAIAAAGKANGALVIGQLSHPGNQLLAHIRLDAISASDIQLGEFLRLHAPRSNKSR
jgi:2,4-dienoyl-CoA reductase-like NADH-dependent reductase (Old Yellow Enzyme family)